AFAPAIGPSLSGWIVDNYPWQTLFQMILPIAVLDLIVAFFILRNVTERTFPKLDVLSIVLSSFGFGGLLYGFSVAGTYGWGSPQVLVSLIGSSVVMVLFIHRQLRLKQPVLEFRVFRYSMFTLNTAIGMVVFLVMRPAGSATEQFRGRFRRGVRGTEHPTYGGPGGTRTPDIR